MKTIVDLTKVIDYKPERKFIPLKSNITKYTGVVYDFIHDSMCGTYIDFPGHILETDDNTRANNIDLKEFYRMPCSVIHLNFNSNGGAVGAKDLEEAFGGKIINSKALIINALGKLEPDEIDERSVWLDDSAVEWIKNAKIKLLISDIFESKALEGVFLKLFKAGISTVCMPANLFKVTSKNVELTVLFSKYNDTTQLPCSVIAEF